MVCLALEVGEGGSGLGQRRPQRVLLNLLLNLRQLLPVHRLLRAPLGQTLREPRLARGRRCRVPCFILVGGSGFRGSVNLVLRGSWFRGYCVPSFILVGVSAWFSESGIFATSPKTQYF